MRAPHVINRLAAPALVLAAALAACSEVKTGPDTPVALSFDSLPAPSIVIGDTLRDSTGAAVPFRATAFNSDGDPIPTAPIHWFVLTRDTLHRATGDTVLLAVDSLTGVAVAPLPSNPDLVYTRSAQDVTIVPQVNGLAGPTRQIALTLRPDSLATTAVTDTAGPSRGDTTTVARVTKPVQVQVLHDSASLGQHFLPVRAWIVRYALEYHGAAVSPTSRAFRVVTDVSPFRRSDRDTTDASGSAARRVAIDPDSLTVAATGGVDSITVVVTATYRGLPLRGAPARVTIPMRIAAPGAR